MAHASSVSANCSFRSFAASMSAFTMSSLHTPLTVAACTKMLSACANATPDGRSSASQSHSAPRIIRFVATFVPVVACSITLFSSIMVVFLFVTLREAPAMPSAYVQSLIGEASGGRIVRRRDGRCLRPPPTDNLQIRLRLHAVARLHLPPRQLNDGHLAGAKQARVRHG